MKMSEVITKLLVDCSTGIATEVPLTDAELAQRETDRLAWEAQEAARLVVEEAKETAKASANAKLKALGLTDAEIAAITS
jgi:hypothetical protein